MQKSKDSLKACFEYVNILKLKVLPSPDAKASPVSKKSTIHSVHFNHIRIHLDGEGRIEKSVQRITVLHHEVCRVMTNGDPEGRIFYPILTGIMDSFSCTPLFFF